jgi:hypothetical protein
MHSDNGAHIARKVVYFDNTSFFISTVDGSLYIIDSEYTTFDGEEIPRVRILPPIRSKDTLPFLVKDFSFLVEQGNSDTTSPQRIDVSISKDGAESFSNAKPYYLNSTGHRKNIFRVRQLGRANDLTIQIKLWRTDKFSIGEGIINISR